LNIITKYIFLIFAALFGFSLSLYLGWVFYEIDSNSIEVNFQDDVDDKAAALEREILLNIEVLYSIKGLFDSSKNVESEEFTYLTANILVRQKNIQALAWIPKINQYEREEHEVKRKSNHPDFEFTELESSENLTRAHEREIYFPVYYIEPISGNEIAMGFDLASNSERLKTLEIARDTGTPQATANLRLLKDNTRRGFLIFIPVYDGSPNTLEKRRERLRGFVVGIYRASDLFSSALKRTAAKGINFSLIDITNSENDILYESSLEDVNSIPHTRYEYKKDLDKFGGRTWSIIATPTSGYIAARKTLLPYATVIVGVLIVILLTIYTFIIIRHSEIVESTVRERTKDLHEAKKKLEALSRTDGLTNIGNRRCFDEFLDSEWNRAIRDKSTISLLMIDIDYFKLYNDKYGHAEGDECLKVIAKTLEKSLKRSSDLVARYGGEEFVIVLPNTKNASAIAETCRINIENLKILHEESKVSNYVTISIGIANISPDSNSEIIELTTNADKALYKSKETGRNKVTTFEADQVDLDETMPSIKV
jgi:diguanylate cyclase (GGDEF)-like protein